MKYKLLRASLLLLSLLFLSACGRDPAIPTAADQTESQPPSEPPVILAKTEDMGEDYLNSFIFFGESTTYHLKSRGVLQGGTETRQVWGPDNGTVNLDMTTTTLKIRYPDTGEYLTVSQAAARKKPAYLVLTFGLNGVTQNIRLGKDYYKDCYRSLLDAIRFASPDTRIILQSCFPVAENMDMSRYSCSLDQLNQSIDTVNGWVLELAEEEGLRYLNTAEILKDEAGRLRLTYQNGDGYHLTREAYLEILTYIRTHGYR
ncbi:MAG: hypothetical protein IJW44_01535 [Clostridia bacterium]|nr:hypothetical protein [Clostridia bacterium]